MRAIRIPIGGIKLRLAGQPGEDKPQLFENLGFNHNRRASEDEGGEFFIGIVRNPLKSLDLKK